MKFEYIGIRVINMDESIKFYTELLGMKLLDRGKIPTTKGETAALQSPGSQLVLELNYYEDGSPFAMPYEAGEGLDHLGFKVDDLKATLENLRRKGVKMALETIRGDERERDDWNAGLRPRSQWDLDPILLKPSK
jgi:catechol 2,3-dioxygenase-like lactoylglutathione lyase family enzyme